MPFFALHFSLTGHPDYLSLGIAYQSVSRGDNHYSRVDASEFPFGYGSVDTIYVSLSLL